MFLLQSPLRVKVPGTLCIFFLFASNLSFMCSMSSVYRMIEGSTNSREIEKSLNGNIDDGTVQVWM